MSLLTEYPYLIAIQDLLKRKKIKVYLVGGFVRDYLLKRQRSDFDFAVSKDAVKFAAGFAKEIKGAFVLLDKDRGCARVVKKKDGKLLTFDFADFRVATLKGDLLHRDFTINALCVDLLSFDPDKPLAKQVIDPKKGVGDLKAKKIQMTSSDVFKEDPLRLLRAFSLHATLGFKIEKDTLARIKKDAELLPSVSFERIRDELFKILSSDRASATLKAMDKANLLKQVIPQITVMYKTKQGGYHHLDVWPHSLETVSQLEKILMSSEKNSDLSPYLHESLAGERQRFALMKLAALLHDIGKPQTQKKEKDRMSFHGHEHVGKNIVRHISRNLKLSTRERHILEDLVRWHLRPGYLSNFKAPSRRAVFRYFRDTKEEAVSILLLSLADQRSTRGPLTSEKDQKHHEKIAVTLVKKYFEEAKKEPFVSLINGNDLIKKLKLKPSPLFSKVLSAIEEQQTLGKVTTKKEALDLARKLSRK